MYLIYSACNDCDINDDVILLKQFLAFCYYIYSIYFFIYFLMYSLSLFPIMPRFQPCSVQCCVNILANLNLLQVLLEKRHLHLLKVFSFVLTEFSNKKSSLFKSRVTDNRQNKLPTNTQKKFPKHAARKGPCSTNSIVLKLYPAMSGVRRFS